MTKWMRVVRWGCVGITAGLIVFWVVLIMMLWNVLL